MKGMYVELVLVVAYLALAVGSLIQGDEKFASVNLIGATLWVLAIRVIRLERKP